MLACVPNTSRLTLTPCSNAAWPHTAPGTRLSTPRTPYLASHTRTRQNTGKAKHRAGHFKNFVTSPAVTEGPHVGPQIAVGQMRQRNRLDRHSFSIARLFVGSPTPTSAWKRAATLYNNRVGVPFLISPGSPHARYVTRPWGCIILRTCGEAHKRLGRRLMSDWTAQTPGMTRSSGTSTPSPPSSPSSTTWTCVRYCARIVCWPCADRVPTTC